MKQRLIDGHALMMALCAAGFEHFKAGGCHPEDGAIPVREAMDICDHAPTVDAVPVVHGRWVYEPDRVRHWHCSECKQVVGVPCAWYCFCPTCGADMRGDGGAVSFEGLTPPETLPKGD